MLLRTLSILAIVAALGSAGVAYYEWSVQIPALVQQRDAQKQQKAREIAAHESTRAELAKTTAALKQGKQELANTKVEQQVVLARTEAQEKRADKLQNGLATATSDLENTSTLLARYKATGLKPGEVDTLNTDLLAAQRQQRQLIAQRDETNREYSAARERLKLYTFEPENSAPVSLTGNVVQVDPKWNFAILNVGENQGVKEKCELLVSRNGKLIGKVVVAGVQKDRCIGNFIPEWKFGEIMEGDLVTPANPASSLTLDSEAPKTQAQ